MRYLSSISLALIVHVLLSIGVLMALACTAAPSEPAPNLDATVEALVKQVFQRITIDGKDFVDIEPKPEYAPLFATMVTAQKVGYQELGSAPSPQ